MTLENFNYRTNPMFLRNQFESKNVYGIPTIPKSDFSNQELEDLRLLAFNSTKSDRGEHKNRIVHFFLYDYNFEKVWVSPEKYTDTLSLYKGVLTPDFSMYLEMPYSLQIYNTFRNRWCGAFFAKKGIRVIPTVNWTDKHSYDFCFQGIEKGSIVAVSTYMFHEHNNHAAQKELFMNGYNKMLETIEPTKIICYSEPFDEMQGDIIYINYELSSWKHLNDDKSKLDYKKTYPVLTNFNDGSRIYKIGYVCKGGGSAYGGAWIPKSENDQRLIGKPNSIRENIVKTSKGQYVVEDKYGNNGYAISERHYTDHIQPDKHSNPHDHIITWEDNHPNFSPPTNYEDGNVPEFKKYNMENFIMKNPIYNPDDYKFETLGEFKLYLSCGANVGFEWNGKEYGIEGHNNSFDIWEYYKGDIANGLTLEQILDFEFDDVKLRDFILSAKIIERIM